MSQYNNPTLYEGHQAPVFNTKDFETVVSPNQTLTEAVANQLFMPLTGGTFSGNVSFPVGLTCPTITLSSNTVSQTSNQLGYTSISSSSSTNPTTATVYGSGASLTLPTGVWMITTNHQLSITSSAIFSSILHGLGVGSTSSISNTYMNSTFVSESVAASSTKTITASYVVLPTSSTTYYPLANLTYTGAFTDAYYIQATRIA